MMKNNKILISPKQIEDVEKYKKIGITNFLFALENFSVGYEPFNIETLKELDVNIYLNINILMDTKKINEFKKIIAELTFVKGIFFEDLGIYKILENTSIPLIWNQSHFVINSKSINFWLNRVESACLSNELTKEEIIYILDNSKKPLVLPIFGHNIAMYSRRLLLTNFNRFKGYKLVTSANLEANDKSRFFVTENDNGTAFFYKDPFNYYSFLKNINDNKILLYYFDNSQTEFEEYLNIINNKYDNSDERFLDNKTIYKLEDY